jgi:pyridoxamine 5'-phosphate oxidase
VNLDSEIQNPKPGLALAELRKEYTLARLNRGDLAVDPIEQFQKWFKQALEARLPEPSAMTLATVNRNGQPSARIVLLKRVDERGFSFYTNYESQKGRELIENPHAALVIYWTELERQVRITGEASKLSRPESEFYFQSRPRASRLAAWVSQQSQVVRSREELEKRMVELANQYPDDTIPLPPNWGGFIVSPSRIEFWQGRTSRLHDRFRYTKLPDGNWLLERLAP